MSTASNHARRSHRSQYRARAFMSGRASVITPSLHRQHSFDLLRLMRGLRRKQPENRAERGGDDGHDL